MIIDTQFNKKDSKLIVSYVKDDGTVDLRFYYLPDCYNLVQTKESDSLKHPTYTTWDKYPVKKELVERPNRYSIRYYLDDLPEEERNIIYGFRKPKVYFIDIETAVVDGFPDPKIAPTEVLSIAIVCDKTVVVLATKEMSKTEFSKIEKDTNKYFEKFGIEFKFKFAYFDSEYKMMNYFINKLVPTMPVITGLNFVSFDLQFLMNRATKLGIDIKKTSLTRRMNKYKDDEYNESYIIPAHKIIVDYLDLCKKLDQKIKIKDSLKLDFVADNYLDLKKIHYEGNLMLLYNNDYTTFIYYNIVDTLLVYFIDMQAKFIDIMLAISDLAKIKMVDSLGTVAVTEGVLQGVMKDEQNIIFVKKDIYGDISLEGGYVKSPIPGFKRLLGINDFASLYPTTIREFNIAFESYLGKYDAETHTAIYEDRVTPLNEGVFIYNVFGTVFKHEESTTKRTFTQIYADRKKNKKLMGNKIVERQSYLDKIKELESMIGKVD